jgi:hypothetical protein
MLRERQLILERIDYCCKRIHCESMKQRVVHLLDKIEELAPELIIRKNPNVVAAQLVCLVARVQERQDVTHTTLGLIMNTSAPSVGKYKHYLEPWVRKARLMQGLRK